MTIPSGRCHCMVPLPSRPKKKNSILDATDPIANGLGTIEVRRSDVARAIVISAADEVAAMSASIKVFALARRAVNRTPADAPAKAVSKAIASAPPRRRAAKKVVPISPATTVPTLGLSLSTLRLTSAFTHDFALAIPTISTAMDRASCFVILRGLLENSDSCNFVPSDCHSKSNNRFPFDEEHVLIRASALGFLPSAFGVSVSFS